MKEEGDELAARERQARDDYWAEQEPLDAEVVDAPTYSCNTELAQLNIEVQPHEYGEVIDAEVIDDCDCDMGCKRGPDCPLLQPPVEHTVHLAVDVGNDGLMAVGAAQLQQDGTVRVTAASIRIRPSGRECWWRLYSTPTSFIRDHQDHGVRAVYARRDNPHLLVMDLVNHGRYEFTALAWRVNDTDPSRTGQTELGEGGPQPPAPAGPDSIDLLVEFPPTLPGKPRHWQQMTQPGQLRHPGNNRENWEFYDWWQGGVGVRFDEGGAGERMPDRLPDPLDGFKPLGHISEEDPE